MATPEIVLRNKTPSAPRVKPTGPKKFKTRDLSNADLIDECDAVPYQGAEQRDGKKTYNDVMANFLTVHWEDKDGIYPIGNMMQYVFDELVDIPKWQLKEFGFDESVNLEEYADENRAVPLYSLLASQKTKEARTEAVGKLMKYWHERKTFRVLEGWKVDKKTKKEEKWPVYSRTFARKDRHGQDVYEIIFDVQRGAAGLLGVVRYGIHMTAYCKDSEGNYKIWVPQRHHTKDTYPNMLDNSVAGGLATGEDHYEGMVRESGEEAHLEDKDVRGKAQLKGIMTYMLIVDEGAKGDQDHIYPECEYIYDLPLPETTVLKPNDGEVEKFHLLTVDEVKEKLRQGRFKTNCSVVLLDFFKRHNLLLTDEEKSIIPAIKNRLHRPLPFPGPHSTFDDTIVHKVCSDKLD